MIRPQPCSVALRRRRRREGGAGLDVGRFGTDLHSGAVLEAFRTDLSRAASLRVARFPTPLPASATGARALVGYRPYDSLRASVLELLSGEPPLPARLCRLLAGTVGDGNGPRGH
jgi:hypothetical protein